MAHFLKKVLNWSLLIEVNKKAELTTSKKIWIGLANLLGLD